MSASLTMAMVHRRAATLVLRHRLAALAGVSADTALADPERYERERQAVILAHSRRAQAAIRRDDEDAALRVRRCLEMAVLSAKDDAASALGAAYRWRRRACRWRRRARAWKACARRYRDMFEQARESEVLLARRAGVS